MSENNYSFFVIAALIAAKLDQASKVAGQLSLTASNARAVALRAGEGAAGFRPLTEFIDKLANVTVKSSLKINKLAAELSRTAANRFRTDNAICRFEEIYRRAENSIYINSLDYGYDRTKKAQSYLNSCYQQQLNNLAMELDTLRDELRTAVILATLSRVEASQAGVLYEDALNNVANNVESAALLIKEHIQNSQKLVSALQQE